MRRLASCVFPGFWILHLFVTPVYASPADIAAAAVPSFAAFADRDGLPQNSANAIAVDAQGHLWVGTQDGVARYNGQSWNPVSLPPNIPSSWIHVILSARDGSVWLGTDHSGLLRWDGHSWSVFNTTTGLPTNAIYALAESCPNESAPCTVWAGTTGGLVSWNDSQWTVLNTKNSALPTDRIRALLVVRGGPFQGALWVGTDGGGLARLHAGSWTVYDKSNSPLPHNTVRSLAFVDSAGVDPTVWAGTDGGGLAMTDGQRWEVFSHANSPLPVDRVSSLLVSRAASGASILYVGTYGGGLARREAGSWSVFTTRNSSLPSNYVVALFAGGIMAPGAVWVGTDGQGLARFREGQWGSLTTNNIDIPEKGTFAMAEVRGDDGETFLWLSTDGGISRYGRGGWFTHSTQNSPLLSNVAYAIQASTDGSNALWFATFAGLAKWQKDRWEITTTANSALPDDRVRHVYESVANDGARELWVATDNGLGRFFKGQWEVWTTKNSGLPDDRVRSVAEVRGPRNSRSLWIGTLGGLARFDQGTFQSFTTKNSALPSDGLYRMLVSSESDGTRALWVATTGGAARLDPDNPSARWMVFSTTSEPAISNNVVYDIVQDRKNSLYMTTNRGVVRLSPKVPVPRTTKDYWVHTFTTEDGLPSNECDVGGAFVDSAGRIWVGTVGGIGVFDPSREVEDRSPKKLILEQAEVVGTRYAVHADAVLAYNQNNVLFEYALLSYFRESETRYSMQLVGFDPTPSPWTRDAKSRYTNLTEGTYELRVWAKDYAKNVSGPLTLGFRVKPAPWRTIWAYLLYVAVVAGGVVGTFVLRTRALTRRTRKLETRVRDRTRELHQKVAELDVKNSELDRNLKQLDLARQDAVRRSDELARKNEELVASHQRADRIFTALADVLPGTILDSKYRIETKIGTGGFGVVFRATHLALGRPVAVKVFRPTAGNDSAQALERFRQEGSSACRVHHPNAIYVFDAGTTSEGIAYLVMELLEGHTLGEVLRSVGVLSVRQARDIVVPITEALSVAHGHGIIHRDIKPSNIFLHKTDRGHIVKLVDFGIAKVLSDPSEDEVQLTGTGVYLGTPAYMAPERFAGGGCDARADVYSLGVTLYQMLSGALPHGPATGLLDMLVHATQEPTPLGEVNPEIPEPVAELVMQTLAKDPDVRPTAAELAYWFSQVVGTLSSDELDAAPVQAIAHSPVSGEPTRQEVFMVPGAGVRRDAEPTEILEAPLGPKSRRSFGEADEPVSAGDTPNVTWFGDVSRK